MSSVTADYPAKQRYRGSVAEDYDGWTAASPIRRLIESREFSLVERIAKDHIGVNSRILDAPTGTGRFLPLLQNLGHDITGFDISADMLKIQNDRLRNPRAPLIRGDCEALPFKNGAFDYIVSMRFLGHVPPEARIRVLTEFRRIASKGIIAGYPVLNPFTKFKFKAGNLRYKIKNGQPRAWWPATPQSLPHELDLAGLKIAQELKLLGPFSQIVFLCLTPRALSEFKIGASDRGDLVSV